MQPFYQAPLRYIHFFLYVNRQVPKDQDTTDLVGRPMVHLSALKQATGEVIYCDDMHKFSEELYLALVLSTRAHAKILSIDESKALTLEGVVAFFSAKDIPEKQRYHGPVFHDEEVFASEKVDHTSLAIFNEILICCIHSLKGAVMPVIKN